MRVSVPRSAEGRRERCYACLIRRVGDNPTALAFDGRLLRCGIAIDESALWPGTDWPATPLLLEHAGADYRASLQRPASGFGSRRRPQIHILWRYERGEWRELVRSSSVDGGWIEHFAAIARVEIARSGRLAAPADIAARTSARFVEALDRELGQLDGEERVLVLGFLYEELTARVVELDRCA